MISQDGPAFVRAPLPASVKESLDDLCADCRKESGLNYGETVAACIAAGIRVLRNAPRVYSPFRGSSRGRS